MAWRLSAGMGSWHRYQSEAGKTLGEKNHPQDIHLHMEREIYLGIAKSSWKLVGMIELEESFKKNVGQQTTLKTGWLSAKCLPNYRRSLLIELPPSRICTNERNDHATGTRSIFYSSNRIKAVPPCEMSEHCFHCRSLVG